MRSVVKYIMLILWTAWALEMLRGDENYSKSQAKPN
jgi:hypothetical protein